MGRRLTHRRGRSSSRPRSSRATQPRSPSASADLLRAILNGVPGMIGYWDRNLRNRMANSAYLEYFGLGGEGMYGMHIRDLLGPELYAQNLPFMQRALAGEPQHFEREIPDRSGRLRYTQASYIPDTVGGVTRGFFVLVTDISALRAQQNELQRLARQDALTGLLNRRGLFEALGRERARHERHGQPAALVVLDLDHFKEVNDNFGHAAGDRVLVEIARLLKHRLRSTDLIARQGGDEFAAVLVGATEAAAERVGADLSVLIAKARLGNPLRPITASVGVASIESSSMTADPLSVADARMYHAKHSSRTAPAARAVGA